MAPEPAPRSPPHQAADGLALDTVAAFLGQCGLHRAAGVLREEAASAVQPSNEAIASSLNRLAAEVLGIKQAHCCSSGVDGGACKQPHWPGPEIVRAGVGEPDEPRYPTSTCGSSTGSRLDDADGQSDDGQLQQGLEEEATAAPAAPAAAPPAGGCDGVALQHTTHPEPAAAGLPAEPVPASEAQEQATEQQQQQQQPPGRIPEPSAHYDPSRVSASWGHDEYRDDADPGYRVLTVSEAELLADMQERYRERLLAAFRPVPQPAPPVPVLKARGDEDGASAELEAAAWPCPDAPPRPVETLPERGGHVLPAPQVVVEEEEPCQSGPVDTAETASPVQSSPSCGATLTPVASRLVASIGGAEPALDADATVPVQDLSCVAAEEEEEEEVAEAPAPALDSFKPSPESGEELGALDASVPITTIADVGPAEAEEAARAAPVPYALAATRKPLRQGGQGPKYRHPPSKDQFYPAEFDGVVYDSFPLKIVYERNRTGFEETKEFPIQMNSIVAARYQVLAYLGSAAFSRAIQCLDLHTGDMVCMKIIKNDKDFVDQSLDEIKLLNLINTNCDDVDEKHCLRMIDCFYHKEHLIIVTELLRDNLYEFSKFNREQGEEPYFTLGHLQRITKQLLTALDYVHGLWLMHCDLKPENILVKSYSRCEVKLIDFGSSCFLDDRLSMYVQSRSYRAPEVLLGLPYSQKIDVWSLGCVIAELWTGYVLFGADCAQTLLARIAGIIGPFPRHMLAQGRFAPQYFTQDGRLFRELEPPQAATPLAPPPEQHRRIQLLLPKQTSLRQRMRIDDEPFLDFLSSLLQIDPELRPTSREALDHPWLAPGLYTDGL